MQKQMHIEPQGEGLAGLVLTVVLWTSASAMSMINGLDAVLMLFVHMLMGLSFMATCIAACCTASPTLKAYFEKMVKRLFRHEKN